MADLLLYHIVSLIFFSYNFSAKRWFFISIVNNFCSFLARTASLLIAFLSRKFENEKIFLQIVQWQIELPLRDAHDFFSLVYPDGHMNLNGKWLSEGKCKKAHSFLWFDFPIILIRYWNPSEHFHLSRVEKFLFLPF